MHLSRTGIERYRPRPSTTPTVDPAGWLLSLDGGATGVVCEVMTDEIADPGEPTWLLAGPLAVDPGSATVVPECVWTAPDLGYPNSPELLVRVGPAIWLT